MEFKLNRTPTPKELSLIAQYAFTQHLNYKCPENPPGSGNFTCEGTDKDMGGEEKSEPSGGSLDMGSYSGDKYTPGKSFKAKDIAIANKDLRDTAYAALGENESIRAPQPNDTPEEKKKWGEFVERVDKLIPNGSIDAVHQRILEDMNHHGLNKALMDTGKFQEGTGYPGPTKTDEDMKKFKEFFDKPENQAAWDLADKKFEEFNNKLKDDKFLYETTKKKATTSKSKKSSGPAPESGISKPPEGGFKSVSEYHTYVRDNIISGLKSTLGKGRAADDRNRMVEVLDMVDKGVSIPDAMVRIRDQLGKEATKLSKTGNSVDADAAADNIRAANVYADLADKFKSEGSQFNKIAAPKDVKKGIDGFIGGLGVTPHQGKSVAKFDVKISDYTGKPDIKMTVFRDEFPPGDAGKEAMRSFSSKVSKHIKETYGESPITEHNYRKKGSSRYYRQYNM